MTEIKVPKWGVNMEDAVVLEWLKAEGDSIAKGEPIVTMESDKVTGDVECPSDGVLVEISAAVGETVEVGGILGRIEDAV